MVVGDCGWLWVVVGGCGWFCMVVGGCRWLWLVVGRCRWLWMVVADAYFGITPLTCGRETTHLTKSHAF